MGSLKDLRARGVSSTEPIGRWMLLAIASSLILKLTACTSQSPSPQSATVSASKSRVVTTFLPITQFTKAVAGDRVEVVQLLPTNLGPHDYQAKPGDVQKISQAKVLVENGLGVETFLAELIQNSGNTQLLVIDSSTGVPALANPKDKKQDHPAQNVPPDQAIFKQEALNPHIWLDPKRVMQQVKNIREGLIQADPAGKDIYTTNAAGYLEKLKQLDAEFTQALKPHAGQTFVTYHDFAAYFAQSYNLKANFLVGVPEENPSPDDVRRVIKAAQESNLKTLLTEPQANGNPFSALAQDLKVQISDFDSLETSGTDSLQPGYYLTTMRQNLKNLQTALGEATQ